MKDSSSSSLATKMTTSTTTQQQMMHDVKIEYCVRIMKNNIEYLSTCVYVVGSTQVSSSRSIEICRSLGAALAQVKNVTLVTTGCLGVQDLVAKAFLQELHDDPQTTNRIVHVLPLKKEDQDKEEHEPMSYGKTLFLGESLAERSAVLPRLLDTCILIEGDCESSRQVHDFIWNDHFVIPIVTEASSSSFKDLPPKVFDKPSGVDDSAWDVLSCTQATPNQVADAVVKVVLGIKQHIVWLQQNKNNSSSEKKDTKSFRRRSSKKKIEAIALSSEQPELPVFRNDDQEDDDQVQRHSKSSWKKVKTMITFSSKRT